MASPGTAHDRFLTATRALASFALLHFWATNTLIAGDCQNYSVTIVSGPFCSGFPPVEPQAINQQGEIAGYYIPCGVGVDKAFSWSRGSLIQVLTMPAGTTYSRASGLNDTGWIIGEFDNTIMNIGRTGFAKHADQFINLPPPAGGNWTEAHGINGQNTVVGFWANTTTGPGAVACYWQDGRLTSLTGLDGPNNKATAINEVGVIAGWMGSTSPVDPTARAFIWANGRVTRIDPPKNGITCQAAAINSRQQLAGSCLMPNTGGSGLLGRAWYWSGSMSLDLGVLPNYTKSTAFALNDSGVVVGYCNKSGLPNHGFVWRNGVMTDLNSVVPGYSNYIIRSASGINNAGQIACEATSSSGGWLFLLTPIPSSPADLNGDCNVGPADLAALLASWGQCGSCAADLNQDGQVGPFDLAVLLGDWG